MLFLIKKKFEIFNFIILIFLVLKSLNLFALGYVDVLKGKVLIEIEGEAKILEELDEINLNQSILLDEGSEITILIDDGTTLVIKGESNFKISEYEDIFSINPHYAIDVIKGDLMIETGELPKLKKNSSYLNTPAGKLFLNGTAVAAKLDGNNSEIFLLTDFFGGEGELILETKDGKSTSIELNSGLSLSTEGIKKVDVSDSVKEKQESIKLTIAQSAVSDEKKIEQVIQKKIESGKLSKEEAIALKEELIQKKEKKIDQIVASSKSNTAILGEMLKNSNGDSGSKILEKVIEINPKVTSQVLDTVLDKNQKLFNEISSKNEALTEKLIKTAVKEANENDTSLSKIIAKTDSAVSSILMNEINENKKDLMIKIVAETSNLNPNKLKELNEIDPEISNKITSTIVEKLSESVNAKDELKKIMVDADPTLTSAIVSKTAELDSKLVDSATKEILIEEKDKIIEKLSQSIDSAESNKFSELLISKAIETGNTSLVTQAAEQNLQNKINSEDKTKQTISNNTSTTQTQNAVIKKEQVTKLSTEESLSKFNILINQETEKLKVSNPELQIEKIMLTDVKELLASPN